MLRRRYLYKEREMLDLNYDHEIPEMTVEVARVAFPEGNVVMRVRDELGLENGVEAFRIGSW